MNWSRRFPEWLLALREEKRTAGRLPWLTFVQSLFGGVVPKREWVWRMRVCAKCPFFDRSRHLCRSLLPFYRGDGCRCFTPFLALVPDAHRDGGCYGYLRFGGALGWPAYHMGIWERLWSPIRFLRRK